ncbi:MAG: hypothetical protein PHV16_00175 [Candidatus Nanoarchaeia archaeon]|nr:hypothetical protein [Candidatus Nanoarchaeia archaeon]
MLKKRGQAAVEYLLVGALLVLVILPTIYFFYSYSHSSQEEIKKGQITKVGNDLVDITEQVYYLGYPSKVTVESTMPEGIVGIEVWENNELVFFLEDGSQIPFQSNVNITSNRKCTGICKSNFTSEFYSPGLKRIVIEAKQDYVLIRGEGDEPSVYCSTGETKLCLNQEGVCEGSYQECTIEGLWPGCTASTYFDWGGGDGKDDYSETEICDDGLDNNCNGLTDCEDNDCLSSPYCLVCRFSFDEDSCESAGCKWCNQCSNNRLNKWGEAKCIDIDSDCGYLCVEGECEADCEENSYILCGTDEGECEAGEEEIFCIDCKKVFSGVCEGAVNPQPEICDDGLDNNCNGLIDCEDSDCLSDLSCICAGNTDSSSCTSAGCHWCAECKDLRIFDGSANCVPLEEDCSYGNCNMITCGAECDGQGYYYDEKCGPENETGECKFGVQEIHCEDCLLVGKECVGAVNPQPEICDDGLDNDCDEESDYDNQDGRHGDNDCPVAVTAISVSDSNPVEHTTIEVSCTSSVANVTSIKASVGGVACSYNSWSGNIIKFNCNVGSSGTKTALCSVDTTKSYKAGSDQDTTIIVSKSDCSGYSTSSTCEVDPRCDWCAECSGTKYSWGVSRCVTMGSCEYLCSKGNCGALCDETQGPTTQDYHYQSGVESPTQQEDCYFRDYSCTEDCGEIYSDDFKYSCGVCKYIDSTNCIETTLGSCTNYNYGVSCGENMICDGNGNCIPLCTDNDGDHYYVQPSGCQEQPGFLGHNDCCDSDIRVYPGQTQYFTTPNNCGNYDYNCDGSETKNTNCDKRTATTSGDITCRNSACSSTYTRYNTCSTNSAGTASCGESHSYWSCYSEGCYGYGTYSECILIANPVYRSSSSARTCGCR